MLKVRLTVLQRAINISILFQHSLHLGSRLEKHSARRTLNVRQEGATREWGYQDVQPQGWLSIAYGVRRGKASSKICGD